MPSDKVRADKAVRAPVSALLESGLVSSFKSEADFVRDVPNTRNA